MHAGYSTICTAMRMRVSVPLVISCEVSNLKLDVSDWTLMGRRACVVGGTSSNIRA